jgi:hypothetical protein
MCNIWQKFAKVLFPQTCFQEKVCKINNTIYNIRETFPNIFRFGASFYSFCKIPVFTKIDAKKIHIVLQIFSRKCEYENIISTHYLPHDRDAIEI